MIKIESLARCTGCSCCAGACPVKAISMQADREGFLYPKIDVDICVNCNQCEMVCPVSHISEIRTENPVAFAAWTKRTGVRSNSSSGGIFTEIATEILRQGGIVFGASFDEHFSVRHIGIETESDLDRLRGSKYVQSEIGMAYFDARKYLIAGRTVLFTGTPCQVAGLYRFLGKEYGNLYTQDIICHGVPSPLVWQTYIKHREDIASAKMCKAGFRNKKYGWRISSIQCIFSNKTEYIQKHTNDLYMQSFHHNLCLRPSCYQCAFKTKNRISDITLADFWGVEKVCPEMDDDKGTSLVILHSSRGKELFQRIAGTLHCREVELEDAIRYNTAMTQSATLSADRNAFIKCVIENGFHKQTKRFLRIPVKNRIRKVIKKIIRREDVRSCLILKAKR